MWRTCTNVDAPGPPPNFSCRIFVSYSHTMAKHRKVPKFQEVLPQPRPKREVFFEKFRRPTKGEGLTLLTVFGLVAGFAEGDGWIEKLLIAVGCTLLLYAALALGSFCVAMYYRMRTIQRESAYGYLLVALKGCFDSLHTAYANDGVVDSQEFVEIMQNFCDALYEFYSYKTTSAVTVSVKLYKPGSTELLYTPARKFSGKRRYNEDQFNNFEHKVQNNTAFVYIVSRLDTTREINKPKIFYLNTCIEKDFLAQKYQSSSIDYLRKHEDNQEPYPLQYGSELVIPILPPFNEHGKPSKGAQVAGFLCIDVAEANSRIFNTGYEYETLLGVGHAIYLLGVMMNKDA